MFDQIIHEKIICCSVTHSFPTLCDPQTAALQASLSLSPRVCSKSCPLCLWCHPIISSSVAPSSSCPQSFPAPVSFPMIWLFASGGQSIGALASVLPMNIQGWFPLKLTGLISLLSKGLSSIFSSTTVPKYRLFGTQSSLKIMYYS